MISLPDTNADKDDLSDKEEEDDDNVDEIMSSNDIDKIKGKVKSWVIKADK